MNIDPGRYPMALPRAVHHPGHTGNTARRSECSFSPGVVNKGVHPTAVISFESEPTLFAESADVFVHAEEINRIGNHKRISSLTGM
jgi:hypothetical protein